MEPKQAGVRIAFVGGFLGAGKTTSLARLATLLMQRRLKVGLVTNDQSANLVDTAIIRRDHHHSAVQEVTGGCFCCRFTDLHGAVQSLASQNRPDVILCEPVGSCTDLTATILTPLKRMYAREFRLAPLSVLIDPDRLREVALRATPARLADETSYIWLKQMEEADILIVNKADLLSPSEQQRLRAYLEANYRRPVLFVSALHGQDMDTWLRLLLAEEHSGGHWLRELDYDRYARGEAALGWLNATGRLRGEHPIDLTAFARELLRAFSAACHSRRAEVAHFKAVISNNTDRQCHVQAHLTGKATYVSSSTPERCIAPRDASLIVNARVHLSPDVLSEIVFDCIHQAAETATAGCTATLSEVQSFSPAYPRPQFRMMGDN